ncbi:LysR family transcriptional regulator [Gordonia sp. TBRC 11910]|uniref:LysR family transcriptional regulator n=1 Tax=Gordonia asplenii TaxID=2725283 RepID=A0A848L3S1_9ACTN|nr:LysR family transcriptional regulator [Gordonia asplenii]NMO05187.1 LysR family transcriptional regulator [Gordonia asplenii]
MDWTSVQLRALVAVQQTGSVRAAADELGYTPGAVSQQISALEREAGTALTERIGRGLRLTPIGVELAAHARRILDVDAQIVAALEASADAVQGELYVGAFASAAVDMWPALLRTLRSTYPELSVVTRELDVDDLHASVASGAIDVAVGLDYPDNPIPRDPHLRSLTLRRERFEIAAPATTFNQSTIRLADLADRDWILAPEASQYGRAVRAVCRRYGVEPRVRHEVTDTAVSMAMVEAGLGIAPATESMLRLRPARVDRLTLAEEFVRDIVAVVRTVAADRPAIKAFLDALTASIDDRPIDDRPPAESPLADNSIG